MRYNNNKPLTKEEKFEKMMDKFLKDSKYKLDEINNGHTKSEKKKAKAENSKRRKIEINKKEN